MNPTDPVRCRRCGRPLHAPLAVAAGRGARCALLDVVEAAGAPLSPALDRTPARVRRAALAVATLAADPTPAVSVAELLHGVDVHDVAAHLADQFTGALTVMLGERLRGELLHEIGVRLAGEQVVE